MLNLPCFLLVRDAADVLKWEQEFPLLLIQVSRVDAIELRHASHQSRLLHHATSFQLTESLIFSAAHQILKEMQEQHGPLGRVPPTSCGFDAMCQLVAISA